MSMEQPVDTKPKPQLTDEYAQSLLRTVSVEHEQRQALKPIQRHFISKKTLVFLIISTLVSILATIIGSHIISSKSPTNNLNKTDQSLYK